MNSCQRTWIVKKVLVIYIVKIILEAENKLIKTNLFSPKHLIYIIHFIFCATAFLG